MIPDIAVIISAYAGVRLANEYLLDPTKEDQRVGRIVLAVVALGVIGYYLFDVFQKSSSLGSTLGGFNLG
jgi:hypothetical protein